MPLETIAHDKNLSVDRFGRFYVGAENALLMVSARAVIAAGVQRFNPLVLYGPAGAGKSFFARQLINAWRSAHHDRSLASATVHEWMASWQEAVAGHRLGAWRDAVSKLDLLLLDDFDRVARHSKAQVELLHRLDDLLLAGKQVVIVARRPPARWQGILPALASRLMAGLTVAVVPAKAEARRLAFRDLLGRRGHPLPDDLGDMLADGSTDSLPALIDMAVALARQARAAGVPIDAEIVRRRMRAQPAGRAPRVGRVAELAAKQFGVSLEELRGPSRRRSAVVARGAAMLLCRELSGKSLQEVGRYFSGRDHTTVLHACRRAAELIDSDIEMAHAVAAVRRRLLAR